jgi:hypothetical protein
LYKPESSSISVAMLKHKRKPKARYLSEKMLSLGTFPLDIPDSTAYHPFPPFPGRNFHEDE